VETSRFSREATGPLFTFGFVLGIGGGIVTILTWIFVVESKCEGNKALSPTIWQPSRYYEICDDLTPFSSSKNLTLEEIDLVWADEEFKRTHKDLRILQSHS
jgi:hypothetical protein